MTGLSQRFQILIKFLSPETLVRSDDDFTVAGKKRKTKPKHKHSSSMVENPRANLHTLTEDYQYLLSNSLDIPFDGPGGLDISSSQVDVGPNYLDDIFSGAGGEIDLGLDITGELAQELGDGWGMPFDQAGDR